MTSPTTDFSAVFENFAEIEKPVACNITGRLPAWLQGTLLRNGPGEYKIGESNFNHWFDGMAYIQRFHFENGKMFFSAKHLRSKTYNANHAANRIVIQEFSTMPYPDPCKNIFQRFFSFFDSVPQTDNALVNFVQSGDRIFAVTETPKMSEIDVNTLETKEQINVAKFVVVNTATAHHHYDSDGNIYNVGSRFGKNGEYVFVKTENTEEGDFTSTSQICSIPMTNSYYPSYYHSFGMTEDYLIYFECPLTINGLKLMTSKITGWTLADCMDYDPSTPVNIHVVDHKTGIPLDIKIKSKGFFTFHHANSYQEGDYLILDFCKIEDAYFIKDISLDQMRKGTFKNGNKRQWNMFHRMVVPLTVPDKPDNKKNLLENVKVAQGCKAFYRDDGCLWVEDVRLCDLPMEFPRYNYAYNTKHYKYCYGAVFQHPDFTAITKVNVDKKTYLAWKSEDPSQLCGEPVFVADPDGVEEDDGVLLCPIISVNEKKKPFMLVLNANDLSEVARCHLPKIIPMNFHGLYVH
ncbi:hypothetical protein L596_019476 [Steinernema carpocapsae]|uniref:Uncharacterized protein n=1 Tax=Steinernema carpocapsae TaxID=34508 RepID=A0A4U5MQT0_STECR|nr:hypothetical protein L596_019476 [Steinernema carpocapsae]